MSGPIIRSGPSQKFTSNFDKAFNGGAAKTAGGAKKDAAKAAKSVKSAKAAQPAKTKAGKSGKN